MSDYASRCCVRESRVIKRRTSVVCVRVPKVGSLLEICLDGLEALRVLVQHFDTI